MIRYVLAVLLTVLIMGIAMPAVDHAAGMNGEKQATQAVSKLDAAATSLYESEELAPRGVEGPRRVVTVRFPSDTVTSNPITTFRIRRVGENRSVVEYRVEGRAMRTRHVSAPIVNETNGTVRLGGMGSHTFVLTLERDGAGTPVVVLRRT